MRECECHAERRETYKSWRSETWDLATACMRKYFIVREKEKVESRKLISFSTAQKDPFTPIISQPSIKESFPSSWSHLCVLLRLENYSKNFMMILNFTFSHLNLNTEDRRNMSKLKSTVVMSYVCQVPTPRICSQTRVISFETKKSSRKSYSNTKTL